MQVLYFFMLFHYLYYRHLPVDLLVSKPCKIEPAMLPNNSLYLLLLIAVDILAIYHLYRRVQCSAELKVLWTLVIILLPILGVAIFYMWITLSNKNRGQSRRKRPWDR